MKRWLLAAVLITCGWVASPGAVPIYDGVSFPDQPYRLVGKDPAPKPVALTVPVVGEASASFQLRSAETGPQVLIDLARGAFTTTTTGLTLSATPLLGTGTPPRGTFDGNVYRITVTGPASCSPIVRRAACSCALR